MSSIFSNARIVLPDASFVGSVCVRDGVIAAIDSQPSPAGRRRTTATATGCCPAWWSCTPTTSSAMSRRGPRVTFPMPGAVQAHDAEMRRRRHHHGVRRHRRRRPLRRRLSRARPERAARGARRLRAARRAARRPPASTCAANCRRPTRASCSRRSRATAAGADLVMDHTPGQRQWRDLEHARVYYTARRAGATRSSTSRCAWRRNGRRCMPVPNTRLVRRFRAQPTASRWPRTTTPPSSRSTRRCRWAPASASSRPRWRRRDTRSAAAWPR